MSDEIVFKNRNGKDVKFRVKPPKIESFEVEEKVKKYKLVCPDCGKVIIGRSEKDALALLERHKRLKGCGN